jgi:hypothetical protein
MHLDRTKRLPEDQEAIVAGQDDAGDERAASKDSSSIIIQISWKSCWWTNSEVSTVINGPERAYRRLQHEFSGQKDRGPTRAAPARHEGPQKVPAQQGQIQPLSSAELQPCSLNGSSSSRDDVTEAQTAAGAASGRQCPRTTNQLQLEGRNEHHGEPEPAWEGWR